MSASKVECACYFFNVAILSNLVNYSLQLEPIWSLPT